MDNVSLARFCFRFAASIGAACLLLLGGCATYSAPYEYTVALSDEASAHPTGPLILPPGAVVGGGTVTFVVEHPDANPSCLLLPEISEMAFRISSVYWRDISMRGTRIDVDQKKFACEKDEGLRKCMRRAGASAMTVISSRPEWSGCVPNTTSMEESFPYDARESLEENLGFAFVSEHTDFVVMTMESESSTDHTPSDKEIKVNVAPGQVSSVNLRPGMKICVQAEQSLTDSKGDRARLATPEHCARFIGHDEDHLAFPGIDQLAPTIYVPLFNAHRTVAIYGVYGWSGIRSHAVNALGNAFQLTVYFPRVQAMDQVWKTDNHVSKITDPGTTNAGPLVLLSGTKRVMPPGRQVQLKELCGLGKFSCFLFMDRPSVRITQDIPMGEQVLEAELGMTLGDLAVTSSLPPVELSRPFRGRPIPFNGTRANLVPLVPGDALRRLHD